jgi:glycosyltransferase involved in cell wall biosynthesis
MENGANMQDKPRAPVSVVIPCYNCADTIERALRSIIGQTLLPQEVWIVDDGSDERTKSVLGELKERFSKDITVNIITLPSNMGQSVARNKGWDSATQPYIAFLDADDSWHPKKIEVQYNWMKERPEVALTGHKLVWIRNDLELPVIEKNINIMLQEDVEALRITPIRQLLSNRWFQTPSVILKKDIPFRFPEEKRYSEDYLLWLRLILRGYQGWRLNIPLGFVYKAFYGMGGATKNIFRAEIEELKCFKTIRSEGLIGYPVMFGVMLFSVLKFMRRILFVCWWRIKGMLSR